MNLAAVFAVTFVDQLVACGLREACISPGSRSAPLAMALARHPALRVLTHVDERSSSFFALGLARQHQRPVVVLCTSGTAAAEIHPAVIEADLSRIPLLVLTADRPPELRDVGANQVIDQVHLYGRAVRWFADPGPPGEPSASAAHWRRLAVRAWIEASGPVPGPVHVNLPFREPLVPDPGEIPEPVVIGPGRLPAPSSPETTDPGSIEVMAGMLDRSERPLVVAGGMRKGACLGPALDALGGRRGAVIFPEPTSQLRVNGVSGVADAYDVLLRGAKHPQPPDLVIRLGATPTSKALNGWLAGLRVPTVLVDPEAAWADPDSLACRVLRCPPEPLLGGAAGLLSTRGNRSWQAEWMAASARARSSLERSLARSPLHEGHVVAALAERLPGEATLTVGASMPIRDVDTFWPIRLPGPLLVANRGASGIDGVVSSGLGPAAAGSQAVILIGDLSLYHDMNGLWAIRRHRLDAKLIVLDNDGGGIFSFLPQAAHEDVFEEIFATPLGLRLEDVAKLYGLDFTSVDHASGLAPALDNLLSKPTPGLLAVHFTRRSSVEGHRAAWTEVAAALS